MKLKGLLLMLGLAVAAAIGVQAVASEAMANPPTRAP